MSLILSLAALAAAQTPGDAVVELNRQACTEGTLHLDPSRGELVDITKMPDIMKLPGEDARPEQVTFIRFKNPSRTFVVIERYNSGARTKFEVICKVASRLLPQEAADKAFHDGVEHAKVRDTRYSGHPNEPFVIDQPKAGLRKRLFAIGDWVMIETSIYKQAQ